MESINDAGQEVNQWLVDRPDRFHQPLATSHCSLVAWSRTARPCAAGRFALARHTKFRIPDLADRHQFRVDLRQGKYGRRGLWSSLHDGHDAICTQALAAFRSPEHEASV